MKLPLLYLALMLALLAAGRAEDAAHPSMLIVTGAGGTPEYTSAFAEWGAAWQTAANKAGVGVTLLSEQLPAPSTRERLREILVSEPHSGPSELWLVLLGHGTWDGQTGKFNAAGDDIATTDLVEWLTGFQRPVIVIAAFSSGGAFLKPLSAPGRIIVTATRTGSEENFSHFGQFLSASIGSPAADLDRDGEVSLLEAWLTAARGVADFYKSGDRLATEHSLLDDNGDSQGTPADWYEGLRLSKKPKNGAKPDGIRAAQIRLQHSPAEEALTAETRARRDALELDLARLRESKPTMSEDEYYQKLEALLLQLAALYQPKAAHP